MSRYDKEEVRAAAAGQWKSLLINIAGLPEDALSGKNCPCPKCGGTDRFRMLDEDRGAVLCNQCFAKKNGDGFAAIAWATECKFTEAVAKVADYLHVKPIGGKKKANPEKDLVWMDWAPNIIPFLLNARPGMTEEALLKQGARMARYKNQYTVVALPIIGESLDIEKPVGWALLNAMGGSLPRYDKHGNPDGSVKVKITSGSEPGLIGTHAIERLKTPGFVEVCWKVEGVSDLIALTAAIGDIERHVVVTNSNGTLEKLRWRAGLLATCKQVHVLHDADEPGVAGAEIWATDIAAEGGTVDIVQLPYQVAADHGQDVRDWLLVGNTYADLLVLADRAIKKTKPPEGSDAPPTFPKADLILKKLQLEVLYETDGGRIRVFSTLLKKTSWIERMAQLKKENLVQVCGYPAMSVISSDPDGSNSFSMVDVKEAIALAASTRRENDSEKGIGVWQGIDDYGNEKQSLILVNRSEGARWNGDNILRRIVAPRVDGLTLELGASVKDWFDFDQLSSLLQLARDKGWRNQVLDAAEEIFTRWRWRNQNTDPGMVVGLIMATWIQTIWNWRPLVAVIGATNCGKSMFFEALGGKDGRQGIFGGLAMKQAKSTEAGMRQWVANTAGVILIDEFEESKDRERILESLRASSRGETIRRGTTNQQGQSFAMRHIVWVAAIESGLKRAPDLNRFILLELLQAEPEKQGKLTLPAPEDLHLIGQKLLAIALVCAMEAKQLALQLKSTKVEGMDGRMVESCSVPAAILAVAQGGGIEQAEAILRAFLTTVDAEEVGTPDQNELLEAILSSRIRHSASEISIFQIFEDRSSTIYGELARSVEGLGLALRDNQLVIWPSQASKLLRGTRWERQKIKEILVRIPGAERKRVYIGGTQSRCICIPIEMSGIVSRPYQPGLDY